MGFSFSRSGKVGSQVRRIAAEQIDAALADCRSGDDFDKTVHELRRRCKRIRGLLRLVRPKFPGFDRENAAFRNAADALASARDAAVMLETLDEVLEEASVGQGARLREVLAENIRCVSERQDRRALLEAFAEEMLIARKRVDYWTFEDRGFDLLAPGLGHTYARMRKRLGEAEKTSHDEAFHDWRKEAKSHWFHVTLFKDCAPDRLGARRDQLDTLGEYLGDHHNLAVLAEGLEALAGPLDADLTQAISARKSALADKAVALGRQLTAESSDALVSRFEKFWKLRPKDD
jgi:CHAD domain-containing protein